MYSLIIVDDENITRMAISGYIKTHHPEFHVDGVFSSATDALHHMTEHTTDIVITDIRMPKVDGLEFSRHIHDSYPNTFVIIISGYSEFEYARTAIKYGVHSYLLKPLDFQELSSVLLQLKNTLYLSQSKINYDDEYVRTFFADLANCMITSSDEFRTRIQELPFQRNSTELSGCYLTISFSETQLQNKWNDSLDKLAQTLQNSIRILHPQYQIFYTFRRHLVFHFVLLSENGIPVLSVEELNNALYHLLHIHCITDIYSTFPTIDSLIPTSTSLSRVTLSVPVDAEKNDDLIIQKAMEYIQAHYAEDLNREDVANAVFLSSGYFSRFFKQKTGLSFIDYLTSVRMQKAIELLSTNTKISDIAKMVGYQSRNRFLVNFRQYSGLSPSDYRMHILRMEHYNDD